MANDIKTLLEAYQQDVRILCQSYFLMKHLNTVPLHHPTVLTNLNKNSATWNIIKHSAQVTFFVTLGKIFDENGDTHSIHHLMNFCFNNRTQFRKWRMYRRKIKEGYSGNYARSYIKTVEVPRPQFFRELNAEKKMYTQLFSSLYREIRNKVFAHKILLSEPEIKKLFKKTSVAEIEDTLCFLYQFGWVLRSLVDNGVITHLYNHRFVERDVIVKDVDKLLHSMVIP